MRPLLSNNPKPILNLNLRPFFLGGGFLAVFISPFMRGLFFQPELLEIQLLTAVVFIIAWYDQVLCREVYFLRHPMDYAVAAVIPAYALSLFTAVHMRPAIGEVLKYITCFMAYWAALRAVRSENDLDRLLAVCYSAAVGVAAIGLAAAAGVINFPDAFDGQAVTSTLQYKNALAAYLAALSATGLALSVKSEKVLPKLLYAAGNFLLLVALLSTQSRGGWVIYPLGLAALFAGFPSAYRWRASYHLVIFLGCGLLSARLFLPQVLAGNGRAAALYVLALAALTVALQYIYHRVGVWLGKEQVEDRTRRAVALGGLAYLGFVVIFYLFYSATSMQSALASMLPAEVARRMETISTGSTTLPERFEMTRDALRIAAEHPFTGAGGGAWNALYHQHQSTLYWSTEVHNYFAQTLVEAGVIGLISVLAVWGFFIHLVVRLWRRSGREGGAWMSIWGAAVAAFTLGLHSAFDFDLSLAALGMLLWVFFGAVRSGEKLFKEGKPSHKNQIKAPSGTRLALTALAATVGAAVLFVPSASLYAAGKYGAMGARAVLDKNFDAAEKFYLEASRRDPFTASYAGDLAQVYAVKAVSKDDAASHFKALAYAKKASTAEPYNSTVRAAMANVYSVLKEIEMAVQESEALLQANPLLPGNYEILARTSIAAASYYMEQGKAAQAEKYIKTAKDLPEMMKKKNDEMRAGSRKYIKGDPLAPTHVVKLAEGQAFYLSGEYEKARQVLKPLPGNNKVDAEAKIWLAASLEKTGSTREASMLLNELALKDESVIKQYEKILSLN